MKYLWFIFILTVLLSPTMAMSPLDNYPELAMIEDNSLMAVVNPYYEMSQEERIELLLQEIIRRESGGDPGICNLQFGCGSGQGLTGVIFSTEKTCEKALGRELNMFDPEDNLECARWLLDTQGIWPWEPYSGSYRQILIELNLTNYW